MYIVESDNSVVDAGPTEKDVAEAYGKAKGRHVVMRRVENGKSKLVKEKRRGHRLDKIATLKSQ